MKGMIKLFENNFTEKASNVFRSAVESAKELGHAYVGSEHILLGLLRENGGLAHNTLYEANVTVEDVIEVINEIIGTGIPSLVTAHDLTPRAKKIIETACAVSTRINSGYVGTEHILLALLSDEDSKAYEILIRLNVDTDALTEAVYDAMGIELNKASHNGKMPAASGEADKQTAVLDKYGRDLTMLAKSGKLDPVIGREKELERVIQILSRRTKNNPCLIGEPGVGKTAIAEYLAEEIVKGNVPETLKNKRVFTLDIASMLAGAKYRGEFEERFKNVINEVKKAANVILFIDEFHTIVGAGAAEGAVDAANILKPFLARGELQVIGATTINEYRKNIEKDAALERRFQPVTVGEPSEEDAILILQGLKDRYEAHHKVKITDEAIKEAVILSSRYIQDRFLPDKAIDLMDESASRVRLSESELSPEEQNLEKERKRVIIEKEAAVNSQEFEKAAKLRDEEKELSKKLDELKKAKNGGEKCVTGADIALTVSSQTGIPVSKLSETESERLSKLEEIIHQRVIGQEKAVSAVCRAVRRGRVGLKDPKRPVGSFLFLGPTGVGKTELSKALAEAMFGNEKDMIRLDMSEYMEKHTVSKLIGSPPGYIGFDDGGQLTEKVRRRPYSVILFDEIEKAHPDVFNILLQILDDGQLTDSHGRKVDFKNTVIIMTSNTGARVITEPKTVGFANLSEEKSYEDAQKKIEASVMSELKKDFRPEFLNRIDEIVIFRQLTEKDILKIAKNMLKEVTLRLKNLPITVEFAESVCEAVSKAGFDKVYGARPLRRAIQTEIEDLVAAKILSGEIVKEKEYEMIYEETEGKGEYKFSEK